MQKSDIIKSKLSSVDGRDYGAYQSLLGKYEFPDFHLYIDQIPKDPYAPSHTGIYRIRLPFKRLLIPAGLLKKKNVEIAFRDFIARGFYNACGKISKGNRGTGNSGLLTIDKPGQAMLQRSSVIIADNTVEVRFFMGLPATGRKINAGTAITMFFDELPAIVEQSLFKENIDEKRMTAYIETYEDAWYLRNKLYELDLSAFIADGALLPRKSGTSDMPLDDESAVMFRSPDHLRKEIELPHAGTVTGMGIPKGVTLLVGGGYHGKSTLLDAISFGIYNHIPGDGREKCVSNINTVKIRAYSGRYIEKVDISTFIRDLPGKKDTAAFSTENASGSTSQAACIQEAVEMGAEILLMDEDTCATNFMIRDKKMQSLIHKDDEPITAFIDKARQLHSETGISTILVIGGAGDYLDIADHVIQMKNYLPVDVTGEAKNISASFPAKRDAEGTGYPVKPEDRIPEKDSINPLNSHGKKSVFSRETARLNFGDTIIDLTDMEQLIEISQTKAIGQALILLKQYITEKTTLKEAVDLLINDINEKGIDIVSGKISGDFSGFRGFELAGAVNRLRGVRMRQV